MKNLIAYWTDVGASGCGTFSSSNKEPESNSLLQKGDQVKVYLPYDDDHNDIAVVVIHFDGLITAHYDDGDVERLNMDKKVWLGEYQFLGGT